MPPRFIERINRKAETVHGVFNETDSKPPSYISSPSSFKPSKRSSGSSSQTYDTAPTPPPSFKWTKAPRSSTEDVAIPKGALILVTGANSFLGGHVVDQLLEHGYRVRGTVRDLAKATWTSKYFEDKYGANQYAAVIVPDMAAKDAFHTAIEGCSGVVHCAAVTSMSSDSEKVILPNIAGVLNALEAAASEPSVVRFVYTSAISATITYDRSATEEIASDYWNMLDFGEAWSTGVYDEDKALAIYASSKMQTEAALWRWHDLCEHKFVVNTVLPDTLWGRVLDPNQTAPLSVAVLKAAFHDQPPEYPPCHFADVQDTALLHVASLVLPSVKNQRIFAVNTPWSVTSLVEILKDLFPYQKFESEVSDLGEDHSIFQDAGKALALLNKMGRHGWTDIKTSVRRNCEAFV